MVYSPLGQRKTRNMVRDYSNINHNPDRPAMFPRSISASLETTTGLGTNRFADAYMLLGEDCR